MKEYSKVRCCLKGNATRAAPIATAAADVSWVVWHREGCNRGCSSHPHHVSFSICRAVSNKPPTLECSRGCRSHSHPGLVSTCCAASFPDVCLTRRTLPPRRRSSTQTGGLTRGISGGSPLRCPMGWAGIRAASWCWRAGPRTPSCWPMVSTLACTILYCTVAYRSCFVLCS